MARKASRRTYVFPVLARPEEADDYPADFADYLKDRFPLMVVPMDFQADTVQHWHPFIELVVVTRGQGVHFSGADSYALTAGDVFVIQRDEKHGYRETRNLQLLNVIFDLERLRLPLEDLTSLAGYHALFSVEPKYRRLRNFGQHMRLSLQDLVAVQTLVETLHAELAEGADGHRCLSMGLFLQLLCFLSRHYEKVDIASSRECLRLGQVFSYLEKNFLGTVELRDLCRVGHLSQSSLLRAFKKLVGCSPCHYVLNLRIRRACELLLQTDLSVTEIAFRSGFSDSNYFCRVFKNLTGQTALSYRRTQSLWSGK